MMSRLTGVYVGRLAESVTEEDLINLFQQCGRILRVTIMVRSVLFRGPNIGFVKFDTHEAAKMAVADLHRWLLKGVHILVDFMRAEHIFLKTLNCRNCEITVKPKTKSAPKAIALSTDDILYRTRLKDACSTLNSDIIHSRIETDSHLMDASTILQEISQLEYARPTSAAGLIPIEGSEIQKTMDLLQQRKSEFQDSFLSEVDHLVKYLERQANEKASEALSNKAFSQDSDNQNKICSSINHYSFPATDSRLKQPVSETSVVDFNSHKLNHQFVTKSDVPDLLQTLISADQPKSQVFLTCDHEKSNAQILEEHCVLTSHLTPRNHSQLSHASEVRQNNMYQLLSNHSNKNVESLDRCKAHDVIVPNTEMEYPKHMKNFHASNNQDGANQCCTEVHNPTHNHQAKSNPTALSNDFTTNMFLSSNEQSESCDSDEGYLVLRALRNSCGEDSASAASLTDSGLSSIDAPTSSVTLLPTNTDLFINKNNSPFRKAHSSVVVNNVALANQSSSEDNFSLENKCGLPENSIRHAVFRDATVNNSSPLIDNADLLESSCTSLKKENVIHTYPTSQPSAGSCHHN